MYSNQQIVKKLTDEIENKKITYRHLQVLSNIQYAKAVAVEELPSPPRLLLRTSSLPLALYSKRPMFYISKKTGEIVADSGEYDNLSQNTDMIKLGNDLLSDMPARVRARQSLKAEINTATEFNSVQNTYFFRRPCIKAMLATSLPNVLVNTVMLYI